MIKHYIKTTRTARYFLSQKIHHKIKKVVFVFHGYAQNADDFLNSFSTIFSEDVLFVAPEGLSKFYWKDFSASPSSSWMTSLEREHEITDFYTLLESIEKEIISQLNQSVTYYALGFSQGAAMASRYVAHSHKLFKAIFMYAAAPADDLAWHKIPQITKWHLIYGNKDWYISEERLEGVKKIFDKQNLEVSLFKYEGKHKIEQDALTYIICNL